MCERFWKLQPKIFTQFTFDRIIWKILNEYQYFSFHCGFRQFFFYSFCSSLWILFFVPVGNVAFSWATSSLRIHYRRRTRDCNWILIFFYVDHSSDVVHRLKSRYCDIFIKLSFFIFNITIFTSASRKESFRFLSGTLNFRFFLFGSMNFQTIK